MKTFRTIESWASSVGYVVEFESGVLYWHREGDYGSRSANSPQEVIESVLAEIRDSYKEEK